MNKKTDFRNIQIILSSIFFFLTLFTCLYYSVNSVLDIQLSYWGLEDTIGNLWNYTLMIMATSMHLNTQFLLSAEKIVKRKLLASLFISVFVSLFLSGLISMKYELHNLAACYYFLSYPLSIFLFYKFNKHLMHRGEQRGHLFFVISMVLLPVLLVFPFPGMGVAEIAHSVLVIAWSLWILTL